jgi:hypothetical protein
MAGTTPVLVHNCNGVDVGTGSLNDETYDAIRVSHGDKVAGGVDYQVSRMHDGSDSAADHVIPGVGHNPQGLADYFGSWLGRTAHVDAQRVPGLHLTAIETF